jgi:hypothetical protein
LLAAANAGDKAAVIHLAEAYAGNSLLPTGDIGGVKFVEVNPFMATVYANAAFSFGGEQSEINARTRLLEQAQKTLTPEQISAAKTQADQIVASWRHASVTNGQRASPDAKAEPRSFDEMCER